jgi:hypothetical protein
LNLDLCLLFRFTADSYLALEFVAILDSAAVENLSYLDFETFDHYLNLNYSFDLDCSLTVVVDIPELFFVGCGLTDWVEQYSSMTYR